MTVARENEIEKSERKDEIIGKNGQYIFSSLVESRA